MKVLFAALTAVLLLSITSVTYAHDLRHERERAGSRYDAPVMARLVFDSTRGPVFVMHQQNHRHMEKQTFMRNKTYLKKMRYMERHSNRYAGNDRNGRHSGHNW